MYRIKQMTNNSKQYSSMEWTREKSESRNEDSKADMLEEEKKAEEAKQLKLNKRSSNLETDYIHKAFIDRYIKHDMDESLPMDKMALNHFLRSNNQ